MECIMEFQSSQTVLLRLRCIYVWLCMETLCCCAPLVPPLSQVKPVRLHIRMYVPGEGTKVSWTWVRTYLVAEHRTHKGLPVLFSTGNMQLSLYCKLEHFCTRCIKQSLSISQSPLFCNLSMKMVCRP